MTGTRMPNVGAQSLSLGGLVKGIGRVATGLIPGTLDDAIFEQLTREKARKPVHRAPSGFVGQEDPCPGGFRVPYTNKCVEGPIQDRRPTGTNLPAPIGETGMFGALSTVPEVENRVTFRCPTGLVLGKDNRCYAKGTITNKQRKWPKAPKPPVSRSDAVAIRKAAQARERVKKLAHSVGYSTRKR